MHNCRILTRNLVHTFSSHYTTLLAVLQMSVTRLYLTGPALPGPVHVTWRLVSDIRRGTSRNARAGHDIAGPGLHLEVRVLACQ